MSRKYFLWQLKQWLPMFFILAAILASAYMIPCLSGNPFFTSGEIGYYGSDRYPSSHLMYLMVTALLVTYVFPFFVYSYRYGKQGADTFLCLPVKKNAIRRTRLLIGLLFIEVAMILVFASGTLIFLARQYLLTPDPEQGQSRYILYYGYMVLAFLVMMIFVGGNYFLNCYLMSLGRNVLDAILILVMGTSIVSAGFITLIFNGSYILLALGFADAAESMIYFIRSVGDFGPIFGGWYFYMLFEDLAVYGELQGMSKDIVLAPMTNICLAGYLLLIAWSTFSCFFRDDPSGEYFGLTGQHAKPIALIPHGFALMIGFYVALALSLSQSPILLITLFFLFVTYAVGYYAVLALYNRSFNIGKFHLICYLCVCGFVTILAIFEGVGLRSSFN